MLRLRITFSKTGALRYTGHLDLHKIWERTILRAGLPLSYSQGFHPKPRLHLASALPLGFIGRAEVLDMWLDKGGDPETISTSLQAAAPPGLKIEFIDSVDERGPALQTLVDSAEYVITLLDPVDKIDLNGAIEALLATSSLPRERRGKAYDLRPLVESLEKLHPDEQGNARLGMRLAAREGATGRPEEVLDVLGIPFEKTRIERTALIFVPEPIQ